MTRHAFPPIGLMQADLVDEYFREVLLREPKNLESCTLKQDDIDLKCYSLESIRLSTSPDELRLMECEITQFHVNPEDVVGLKRKTKSTNLISRSAEYARKQLGLSYNEWSEKANKLQKSFIERYERRYQFSMK